MGRHNALFDTPGKMHKGENTIWIVGIIRDATHASMYRNRNHESGFRIFSIEPLKTSKAYDAVKRAPSVRASWSSSFLTRGAFLRALTDWDLEGVGEAWKVVLVCTCRFLRKETVLAVWEPLVPQVVTSC